jgi:hypothetical protein
MLFPMLKRKNGIYRMVAVEIILVKDSCLER